MAGSGVAEAWMKAGERPLRLLLVEDDIDVAAGIGDYLDAHGVQVDFACTAAQAQARLRAAGRSPDFRQHRWLGNGSGCAAAPTSMW